MPRGGTVVDVAVLAAAAAAVGHTETGQAFQFGASVDVVVVAAAAAAFVGRRQSPFLCVNLKTGSHARARARGQRRVFGRVWRDGATGLPREPHRRRRPGRRRRLLKRQRAVAEYALLRVTPPPPPRRLIWTPRENSAAPNKFTLFHATVQKNRFAVGDL